MSKTTGLAAFTRKGAVVDQAGKGGDDASPLPARERGRGKGDVVALTVRLTRAEWERVHQLAVSEGVSIQALAVEGLSKVFVEKGLPKLGN
ncbi:MAG: hypothetical protein ACYDBP_14150 [Leptospirales bacterium]